jgi:hypothetical protein
MENFWILPQRIDSYARQLTIYGIIVEDGKNRDHAFSAVVENVQENILAHLSSLNNMPLQLLKNSFKAQSCTTLVSKRETQHHLQQMAFLAGLEHKGNNR